MIKKVFFKNSRGLTLAGVLHIPRRNGPFPTVVLCHGFGSSKDSPERIKLAEKLAERGFVVLRFDFTGSGESEGRFEEKKLEGQIDDLKHAIDFIQADALVDGERIGASGNSLGGATCIIGASKDKRIKALAAVCPVVYFDPDRALHYLVKDAKHTSTVDAIKK
ncbi:alpha/beta fold hydrolase [Candidatus Micrarchaeota archaeon]|nr:alpha/beta fold hydrolase [Candidatus Micrarchaeota archaeon]